MIMDEIEQDKSEQEPDKKTKTKAKRQRRWSFPTASACRRCGSTDTRAYSTQGKVQYRKCLRAICRHRYTVIGTAIKTTKKGAVT
jgi:hypothetical protein